MPFLKEEDSNVHHKFLKFSEELETFKEIPSDKVSFDERPWMKSAEITDDLIEAINKILMLLLVQFQIFGEFFVSPNCHQNC